MANPNAGHRRSGLHKEVATGLAHTKHDQTSSTEAPWGGNTQKTGRTAGVRRKKKKGRKTALSAQDRLATS